MKTLTQQHNDKLPAGSRFAICFVLVRLDQQLPSHYLLRKDSWEYNT